MGNAQEEKEYGYIGFSNEVRRRAGYKCELCFSTYKVVAHHIIQRAVGGKSNLKNGISLCQKCHINIHNRIFRFVPKLVTIKTEITLKQWNFIKKLCKKTRLHPSIVVRLALQEYKEKHDSEGRK